MHRRDHDDRQTDQKFESDGINLGAPVEETRPAFRRPISRWSKSITRHQHHFATRDLSPAAR
jgi:hypothetical protein